MRGHSSYIENDEQILECQVVKFCFALHKYKRVSVMPNTCIATRSASPVDPSSDKGKHVLRLFGFHSIPLGPFTSSDNPILATEATYLIALPSASEGAEQIK